MQYLLGGPYSLDEAIRSISVGRYSLYLATRSIFGGRYCLYLAIRSIFGGSILFILSNTQYVRGVDTAYTKQYAIFWEVDTKGTGAY